MEKWSAIREDELLIKAATWKRTLQKPLLNKKKYTLYDFIEVELKNNLQQQKPEQWLNDGGREEMWETFWGDGQVLCLDWGIFLHRCICVSKQNCALVSN